MSAGDELRVFRIDAKPTADDDYNWLHTLCEAMATQVFVQYQPPGQRIVGVFRMYRDFIQENLEAVDGEIEGDRFVDWLTDESETRDPTPNQWEGEMFEGLDGLFIDAIETRDMTPAEAFAAYDEYVEELTEEFEQMHDIEGFFENVE